MEGQTSGQPPPGSNQDDEEPPKLDLPEQLQKIVPATQLPPSLNRWNTNEEIASVLIAFDRHKEWLLEKPRIRPPSGSLLMYNRKKVMFRRDGYCWKKRRDGKTNREDHMKLKVKGVECIYGSYVHSAILPTFHRRCYWLLQNPHVVLVHYLNVPNPPNNPKPSLVPSLSGEMRKKEWTKEELVDQLRPMLASDRQGELNPDQDQKVEETLEAIFQLLVNSQDDGGGKSLAVDSSQQQPCRAAVVAAASSFISHRDVVGLNNALGSSRTEGHVHNHCASQPVVKHEVGMVCVQQQGHQLGGCVSTMAHMQVTANTHPPPHQHHLQSGLPAQPGIPAPKVPVLSAQYSGEQVATSGLQDDQPTGIPTTTMSTSLSQLTLATFSHVHLASASSTHPSLTPSDEVHHLHQSPLTTSTSASSGGIPSSVSFLTGLTNPDPSKLAQARQKTGMVHLCPTGLVLKDSGGLGNVVAFASTPAPLSSATQFGSMSQVANPHTHPQPLPGPSKDIPLFAANPLTQCGDDNGCEDTGSCADVNGISSVDGNGGGGSVGAGIACLPDAGDNCDTLDGSFSSLPSTDLNLDLFLDLQDFEDCAADLAAATSLSPPQFPPSPSSPMGATSSSSSHHPLATSSPLMMGGSLNAGCSSSSSAGVLPVSHPHAVDVLSGSYLHHMTSPSAQLTPCLTKQTAVPQGDWDSVAVGHAATDNSEAASFGHPVTHPLMAQQALGGQEAKMEGGGVVAINNFSHCQPHISGKSISNATSTTKGLAICDFSPEWAYTKDHTKVLVAGPWCNQSAIYTCVFDGKHVAASLVQPGVLRCFTPEHKSGCVSLQVAEDGVIISDSHMFEFRDHHKPERLQSEQLPAAQADWFDVPGSQLKQLLLDRLGELQRRFISGDKPLPLCTRQNMGEDSCESGLVSHVEMLAKQQWSTDHMYLKAGWNGLTLLHLASALGFAKLISALIRWRSCNCSSALEIEVDAQSVDNQACTPLMWACAKGQIDAALTLYHWNGAAVGVVNKDGQLPLALARQRSHHNLATQVEQLEQAHFKTPAPAPAKIRCQNAETSSSLSTGIVEGGSVPQPMSPEMVKLEHLDGDSNRSNQQSQPMQTCPIMPSSNPLPPLPPPPSAPAKLVRRFSEQVISPSSTSSHHPLSKRYSVDLLTSDSNGSTASTSTSNSHMRDSTSEPRLLLKSETDMDGPCHKGRTQRVPSLTFDLEPEGSQIVKRKVAGPDRAFLSPLNRGQLPMDTDDGSGRSDSPFIDVERVSSDEEAEKQDESKHQMVTLANQIIAAMPERIKLSPSKGDEDDDGCSIRTRSESHSSSAPSQGSPRPSSSSFGDDSGISTPMTDSLAFEEYRYTDFGTPASSLSPDSTCLPSPYSPYSFALDSPPPTTADFTEYFNAPTTYMEKDFSQLTLSDQEQRKLYEAAKVIQNAYRHYRDKQQQQQQKEIEAAVLIQSYYRRYKQYAYYKKMTHAAVLIQNQFRSYSAQKRKKNPGGSTQGSRRELERLKKGRNQSVIIQQRFR
ncbi:calmodulin-binding transcription activator 2-like [Babylonia areolata]|uniref:calmodulin-binding transcription activator 2-like n=1 Tax=Babylonia areolata TaxID=304850 RepID=UPI003FD64F59